jgi:hypothetical protein
MEKPLNHIPATGKWGSLNARLNKTGDMLQSGRLERAPGMRRRIGPNGSRYIPETEDSVTEPAEIKSVRAQEYRTNTLLVQEWDYTAQALVGEQFEAALPSLLRGYTDQKRTQTGAIDGTSVSEDQVITPKFLTDPNEVLLVQKLPTKYVGVTGTSPGDDGDGNPIPGDVVEWVLLNEAGRAWAAKAATFES